ncbi:methyltransferase regulatory domain-containing protein [Phenylobacterium sp.]|uniref:methyltransferase regulatory domain-containing protein n=1 Tax=Phenylobacterium sp. TaxID=1871053 RepID=UPI0035C78C91
MLNPWSEGYVTGVDYTYGYYRELSPAFQRFCLLLRGVETPEPSTDDVHCELGFGQGVSLAIHGAAAPGRFFGTDFNPAHATHAGGLVAASGAPTLVLDDSFEQLLERTDLPQFSSISLHGVWSWVSRENQAYILELLRRRLRPGGHVFVSYNAFPGWAPAHPLRQLFAMHDQRSNAGGDPDARVTRALDFAEALLAAEPRYLASAPQLPDRLKQIRGQNRAYIAHEYLNRNWHCMYFADMADTLTAAKLEFAGTAVPLDTIDAVCLTPEAAQFLAKVEDPILREQARDYFISQQFRRDLYVRGLRRLPGFLQRDRLLNSRFILTQAPADVPGKVATPLGEANLHAEVYGGVLKTLAERSFAPKSLRDIAAANPEVALGQVIQAIVILVGMGAAAVCQSEGEVRAAAKHCAALNRSICERAIFSNSIEVLASPVIGGAIAVTRFQQLFLLAQAQNKRTPQEWAEQAWRILDQQSQKIVKDGAALESAEANLAELVSQAETLAARMPILKALMVV